MFSWLRKKPAPEYQSVPATVGLENLPPPPYTQDTAPQSASPSATQEPNQQNDSKTFTTITEHAAAQSIAQSSNPAIQQPDQLEDSKASTMVTDEPPLAYMRFEAQDTVSARFWGIKRPRTRAQEEFRAKMNIPEEQWLASEWVESSLLSRGTPVDPTACLVDAILSIACCLGGWHV
jgi:hypothetical protein